MKTEAPKTEDRRRPQRSRREKASTAEPKKRNLLPVAIMAGLSGLAATVLVVTIVAIGGLLFLRASANADARAIETRETQKTKEAHDNYDALMKGAKMKGSN